MSVPLKFSYDLGPPLRHIPSVQHRPVAQREIQVDGGQPPVIRPERHSLAALIHQVARPGGTGRPAPTRGPGDPGAWPRNPARLPAGARPASPLPDWSNRSTAARRTSKPRSFPRAPPPPTRPADPCPPGSPALALTSQSTKPAARNVPAKVTSSPTRYVRGAYPAGRTTSGIARTPAASITMHSCFAGKSPPSTCPTGSPTRLLATSSPQPSAAGAARVWAAASGWAVGSWLGCEHVWGLGGMAGDAERDGFARVRVFSKKLFGRGGALSGDGRRTPEQDWTPAPDRVRGKSFTGMAGGAGKALPGEGAVVGSDGLAGTGWRGETRAAGGMGRDQRLGKGAPTGVCSKNLLTHRKTSPGEGTAIQSSRRDTA